MSINWNNINNLTVIHYGEARKVLSIYDDGDDDGGRYRVMFESKEPNMYLWFHENGNCNIGRDVAYVVEAKEEQQPTVEPSKVGSIDWNKPLETVDGVPARKAPYGHLTDGQGSNGDYHILVGENEDEEFIYFYKPDGSSVYPEEDAPQLRNVALINYTKPIQYVDGSPATYLGKREGGVYAVTAWGCPDASTGNHYDAKGKHVYGIYMGIENVPAVDITNVDALVAEAQRNKKGLESNLRRWVAEGRITVN